MAAESKELKETLAKLKTELKAARKKAELEAVNKGKNPKGAIPEEITADINALLMEAIDLFTEYGSTFTPLERNRKIAAGIKNWGFIQTAYTHAIANPQFVPNFLDMVMFKDAVDDYERKRVLLTLTQQFAKTIGDSMLTDSDSAYHDALDYYNFVKEAARQRVPGAEAEYNLLKPYFKKSKSTETGAEPTEKQIEQDVRSLLHGTKEGKIVIENEKPSVSAGKRAVADGIRTGHAEFKETSEGKAKI
jgi:hypothetical protein